MFHNHSMVYFVYVNKIKTFINSKVHSKASPQVPTTLEPKQTFHNSLYLVAYMETMKLCISGSAKPYNLHL